MANGPRKDFLSWNDTFMLMAQLIAQRSKEPSTQTGAVVVDERNVVLGMGYNGFPRGIEADELPWGKEQDSWVYTKYPYTVHAERNAIYNSNKSVEGGKVYCTLFPCNECAKTIIQNGIKELIYMDDKYINEEYSVAAKKLFDLAGVRYKKYVPSKKMLISDNDEK
ncbi:dCMP deaminase family protein [Candidatus Parcubacteria bacterium]|nr:dCMP deaminase family protein [Candidatus Parcubacteria bacterium]